jgi:hypothetical protein
VILPPMINGLLSRSRPGHAPHGIRSPPHEAARAGSRIASRKRSTPKPRLPPPDRVSLPHTARLGLTLLGSFSFRDPPAAVVESRPEAVLLCGPTVQEAALLRTLSRLAPAALLGGVSPGLAGFPTLLGGNPEGLLAPVQWHADLPGVPWLGPSSSELAAEARASGLGELDYVAAQAHAAALVAAHCLELDPDDPLAAARRLRTTTFFGAFELDHAGLQRGHRLAVVRWRGGRRELLLVDAA